MKDEILRVLEEQNKVTFDTVDTPSDDDFLFVEGNLQSEIMFDNANDDTFVTSVSSSNGVELRRDDTECQHQPLLRSSHEAAPQARQKGRTRMPLHTTTTPVPKRKMKRRPTLLQKMRRALEKRRE